MSRHTAILVVLFAACVLPSALSRDLWDPDEGRYAAIAREMGKGESGLVPRLNDEVYGEKPPLFFWMVAAVQKTAGSTRGAVSRIPSILATLGTLLLLVGMVRRSHGELEAICAGVAFACSILVVQMSSWVGIDSLVTFLVTAAVYAQQRARAAEMRAWPWHLAGYAALAAIVLTKGAPILIAVFALAGFAVLEDGWRGLFPRHLLWGVPLFLGLIALWAVPATASLGGDGEYLRGLTIGQAEKRLVAAGASHERPPWYYLFVLPPLFLPFAVLLPAMAVTAVREWRGGGREGRETGRYVLWVVLALVAFSIFPGKRERYLLPVFPALAALAGIAMVRLAGTPRWRAWVRWPLDGMLAVVGLLGVALAAFPFLFDRLVAPRLEGVPPFQIRELSDATAAGLSIFAVGGLSAMIVAAEGLLRRRDETPLAPVAAAAAFLFVAIGAAGLPVIDRVKSYDRLVEPVAHSVGEAATFGLVKLRPGPFLVALDRHDLAIYEGPGHGRRALARMASDPGHVVFLEPGAYRAMLKKTKFPLVVIDARRVGRREILAVARDRRD
ncbi:MAG: glycosyltransferase family 39 protein [Planctomycetota bacterium]